MRRDFENAAGFVRFGRSVLCAFDLSTAVLVGLLCCCQLVSTGVLASLIHRSRATPLPHHISHVTTAQSRLVCIRGGRLGVFGEDGEIPAVHMFASFGTSAGSSRADEARPLATGCYRPTDLMTGLSRGTQFFFASHALTARLAVRAPLCSSRVSLWAGLLVSVPSSPSLGYCCSG